MPSLLHGGFSCGGADTAHKLVTAEQKTTPSVPHTFLTPFVTHSCYPKAFAAVKKGGRGGETN